MFIGNLSDKKSGVKICVTPSVLGAEDTGVRFAEGGLAAMHAVDGYALFDGTVGVRFDFDREVFLDTLEFEICGRLAAADAALCRLDGGVRMKEAHAEALSAGRHSLTPACAGRSFLLTLTPDPDAVPPSRDDVLRADFADFTFGNFALYGAVDLCDAVYPLPREYEVKEGFLRPTGIEGLCGAEFAMRDFVAKFEDRTGEPFPDEEKKNVSFALADMPEEAFEINVDASGATVRGGSRRALLYASARLLQLSGREGIRFCHLKDAPAMPLRGVHFALPARDKIDFVKRMVRDVFMPMGYNTVFIEVAGAMEYKKHPRINEKWKEACDDYAAGRRAMPPHYEFLGHDILTQEEVRDLCDYLRLYEMEIIPEVETFGHTQYITLAYPELAERAEVKEVAVNTIGEDERPAAEYFHTCCPNHPDYYRIVFDVMDEVLDVFRPAHYVHIGHDEIYQLAECPVCRAQGGAKVYIDEVTKIRDHLKERGLGTMLWSDMMEEKNYAPYAAVDQLPKDIVCLSFTWYFHLDTADEIEDRLVDNGLYFLTGNFYSSHFPRFDSRKKKAGYLGGEVSTWVPCNEEYYAYEGKTWDFLYSADMLWNEKHKTPLRATYNRILLSLMPTLYDRLHYGEKKHFKCEPIPMDLPRVPVDLGARVPSAVAVAPGESVTFSVGKRADVFRFTHATDAPERRVPWQRLSSFAEYTLTYDDGETAVLPLRYDLEISSLHTVFGAPHTSALFRHEGYGMTYPATPIEEKSEAGDTLTRFDCPFDNPRPEQTIVSVTLTNRSPRGVRIFLFDASAASAL